MLFQFRDSLYIADQTVKTKELEKIGATVVVYVNGKPPTPSDKWQTFSITLYNDRINKPHIKDVACHIPKYMTQNGETVVLISDTGLIRAAFVACRAVCELENKSIYEVMVELNEKLPEFEIGRAYL